MKILVFLGLLITSTSLFAQQFAFEVKGQIQDTEKAKYAYLYSAGNKGLFLRVPLVNGTFKFKSNADLDGNLLRWGIIFVEARNNVTAVEVKKNLDTQTWLPGGTAKIKNIILEDIDLDITQGSQINYPEIVGGGIFNKQLKEITATGSAKKINSFEFIKKYPNSPVSVLELETVARFSVEVPAAKIEKVFGGSPQEMYAMLSDRLKQSKEGKAVKMKIEAGKK